MLNYVSYHTHTEASLGDSVTKFQQYIDKAVELHQSAIAFTEHGNLYNWTAKKMACEKAGLKYIHGVECYLTEKPLWDPDPMEMMTMARKGKKKQTPEEIDAKFRELMATQKRKIRDNFHTILLARNEDGVREINELVSRSSQPDHFFYNPRVTFDEFFSLSENVIRISACIASPLSRLPVNHPLYERLVKHYHFLEIQPHMFQEQVDYNRHLAGLAQKYHKPLIAGTDAHCLNSYHAECRNILQLQKDMEPLAEDSCDLTYKSYDQLTEAFACQDSLPSGLYLEAIENTNVLADMVEEFSLDTSFKYPILYGEKDGEMLDQAVQNGMEEKIKSGAITPEQIEPFHAALKEERRVFDKIDMSGFMLFMGELATWCKSHGIPLGFNRGSCGGSRTAYVTNTTDLNPETWHTVFSRFANEDRKEIGDIDIDVAPYDRDKVYDYIISRFGQEKTAFILLFGKLQDKAIVDTVVKAFHNKWNHEHFKPVKQLNKIIRKLRSGAVPLTYEGVTFTAETAEDGAKLLAKRAALWKKENEETEKSNPWSLDLGKRIKALYDSDPEEAKKKYENIFYYYDGLLDVAVSQGIHPAGIVASPITLRDHYGTFVAEDGKEILQIDMDGVHDTGLVKYDILGLKNVGIVKDAAELSGVPYPKSHEVNWRDEAVWKDMMRSNIGIFQFEGDYAFNLLKKFEPHTIEDMSLVTAALRPSGGSYRDDLIAHKPHHNPSPIIDELLKDNNGYLIYQEDTIKFLQQICGLSGSDADNVRRAIGRKQKDRLEAALPDIMEGYCAKSPQPRAVAETEAKEFLQIIEDSSSYQFG